MIIAQNIVTWKGHNIKTGNKFFESVEQFGYLEASVPNQNSIGKAI
jgi:hypothetical protein